MIPANGRARPRPYLDFDTVFQYAESPYGFGARPKPPISKAMGSAFAEIRAQATRTAEVAVSDVARQFALRPWELEVLDVGLSRRTPRQMRKRIAELIGEEISTPRRMDMVQIRMINLKAAAVYAERLIEIERK